MPKTGARTMIAAHVCIWLFGLCTFGMLIEQGRVGWGLFVGATAIAHAAIIMRLAQRRG